eukprot:gene6785-8108_t
MMRYNRDVLGEKQRDGESAAQFYSHQHPLSDGAVSGRGSRGLLGYLAIELTGLYLDGLKHRTRILRKLDAQGMATAQPHLWEQAQRNRNSLEASAILTSRQVTTDLEADNVKEDAALSEAVARQVAQELAQRIRTPSISRGVLNPPCPFSFPGGRHAGAT